MKRFITFFPVLITALCFSSAVRADNTSIADRLQKPVYVVMDPDHKTYNDEIKSALDDSWTASGYAFITLDDFRKLMYTEENLFMVMTKNESVDGSSTPYPYSIQLFYLIRNGSYRINVTAVPLADPDGTGASDILTAVRILQDKLNFKLEKESEGDKNADFADAVEARTGIIKTKKLYIAQDDLDKDLATVDDIKKIYTGDVFVVSREALNKLIENKEPDAVYVLIENFKSGLTFNNSKQVVDAGTGQVLYARNTVSAKAQGFDKNDLERIAK